jgi:hypothetical protein
MITGTGATRRARGWIRSLALVASLSVAAVVVGTGYDLAGGATHAQAVGRNDIVATANAEVGNSESNGGCLKYGPCRELDWCAMFVEWVWNTAGVSPVPSTWVATAVGSWGVERGLFKRGNPLPGDFAVYGEPGSGTGGHVSLVASVNGDGTLTTIDGNSSNAVVRRTINPATATAGSRNVRISGYVAPPNVVADPQPSNGRAFHNLRRANGTWTGASVADGNGGISAVSAGVSGSGELHLVTVLQGRAFHNLRRTDGTWTGAALVDSSGRIVDVAAAGTGAGDMHLLTMAP